MYCNIDMYSKSDFVNIYKHVYGFKSEGFSMMGTLMLHVLINRVLLREPIAL